jgi:hypothetical protein
MHKGCGEHLMVDLFIPTLHTFAMKNTFTGSSGEFRFKISPNIQMKTPKEVDFENSTMLAEYWHGLFCYEKSTVEGQKVFPLTEEGRLEMLGWLKEHI